MFLLFIFIPMDREPLPKKPRLRGEAANGEESEAVTLFHVSPGNERWYRESLESPEAFWDQLAKSRLEWIKPYDKVMDVDMKSGDIKWFLNGVMNVTGEERKREKRKDNVRFIIF